MRGEVQDIFSRTSCRTPGRIGWECRELAGLRLIDPIHVGRCPAFQEFTNRSAILAPSDLTVGTLAARTSVMNKTPLLCLASLSACLLVPARGDTPPSFRKIQL